jgi:protein O-mannosyl-transferase
MRNKWYVMLVLTAATLAVYWHTGNNEFVNLDDFLYVSDNPHVQGGLTPDNVRWAFTASYATNWHPLTWLSHMTDCQLYGLSPWGHHLTSVLFHAANAALLFLFLERATGMLWRSGFVTALFALHPLHVESVAWIAERKDVLSAFFFLLALLAYVRYVEQRGTGRYLLVLTPFALGLMAKPMLVTFPFVLLLLDYWPLHRWGAEDGPATGPPAAGRVHASTRWQAAGGLILEKLPLFLLSAASCIVTFQVQKSGGAVSTLEMMPVLLRIGNAVTAYGGYLAKTLWPAGLTPLYPFPARFPVGEAVGAGLLLAWVSVMAVRLRRRYPFLPVGWFWFLGTLVPVIGLVQVGMQAMADRYSYIPVIGIFIMITWAVSELAEKFRLPRIVCATGALLVILGLSAATWLQIGHWRNSRELFAHTLRFTNNNFYALKALGNALHGEGRVDEAINVYREALRINPGYAECHNDLGAALGAQGKLAEARESFSEALRLQPGFTSARRNLERVAQQMLTVSGHVQ